MAKQAAKAKPQRKVKAAPPALAPEAWGPGRLVDTATPAPTLSWSQAGDNRWLAPDGDLGGARIEGLKNGYLGKDTVTYYVYRDGKYLGSNSHIDAAKLRAERREVSGTVLTETLPSGLPAFLSATTEERRADWKANPPKSAPVAPSLSVQRVGQKATTEEIEVDMTKYEGMDTDQLLKAYNELVRVSQEKGLDQHRPLTRFPDQAAGLEYIKQIESSIRAADEGARAAKKQEKSKRGPVAREIPTVKKGTAAAPPVAKDNGKAKAAPEPKAKAKAAPKQPAAPAHPTGKVGDFLNAIEARPGTNKEKAASLLAKNMGKEVSVTDVCKAVYGKDNPAIAAVLGGIDKTIKAKKLHYELKRKEKSVGLYPAGK